MALTPLSVKKKIVRIIGFMVFKSTSSDSRFQHKNRFWKICTESWDITQNVSIFAGLVCKADFWHFFGNTLGLSAYFSKPLFTLKSWVRAGRFEYHEPYNSNIFLFTFKGARTILKGASGRSSRCPRGLKFFFEPPYCGCKYWCSSG